MCTWPSVMWCGRSVGSVPGCVRYSGHPNVSHPRTSFKAGRFPVVIFPSFSNFCISESQFSTISVGTGSVGSGLNGKPRLENSCGVQVSEERDVGIWPKSYFGFHALSTGCGLLGEVSSWSAASQ